MVRLEEDLVDLVDKIFKLSSEFLVSVSVHLLIVCFYERDFFILETI